MPVQGPRAGGGVTDVKIDTRKWQALLERVYKFDAHAVRVGVLQGKGGDDTHQEPQPKAESGATAHGPRQASSHTRITLAELAAIHEFGATIERGHATGPRTPMQNARGTNTGSKIRIPARSFIRSTFYVRRANALTTICGKLAKQVVTDGMDVKRALGILGAWAVGEVRSTFTEIDIPPPLAQSTIDAKGSSKPLIDTGQLKNSITWELVDDSAAVTTSPGV